MLGLPTTFWLVIAVIALFVAVGAVAVLWRGNGGG